jgi:hypothetical protein
VNFKKKKDVLFDGDSAKNLGGDFLSTDERPNFISNIEKLFAENGKKRAKNNLVKVYNQSYIRTFITIYFIYLKHKIDIYLQQHFCMNVSSNLKNDVGYVVLVDRILLSRCFKESTSILKEVLIASGVTNLGTIREQVRVLIRGEHEFSLLQCKSNLDLPIRSYFMHAQLYVSSIQMSLQQVVVKDDNPKSDPMTIVVKSKAVPMKHIKELLCDSLWNQIQSDSRHMNICKKHRKNEAQTEEEEEEYSIADRLNFFEEVFIQYISKVCTMKLYCKIIIFETNLQAQRFQ